MSTWRGPEEKVEKPHSALTCMGVVQRGKAKSEQIFFNAMMSTKQPKLVARLMVTQQNFNLQFAMVGVACVQFR